MAELERAITPSREFYLRFVRESVTFNRTADEMNFEYEKLSFSAEYKIDIRGRSGVRGINTTF